MRKVILFFTTFLLLASVLVEANFAKFGVHDKDTINLTDIVQESMTLNNNNINKRPNVYLDPQISDMDNLMQLIVLFKNRDYMKSGLSKLRAEYGAGILAEFKIIPAALVETKPIYIIDRIDGVRAIYMNRIIEPPKYFISEPEERQVHTQLDAEQTMGAPTFWNAGYNGTGIVACVIDTGINPDHPELEGKVIAAESFIKKEYGYDQDISNPMDEEGHGTAVAGIIAGKGLDSRGHGVAPNALLMNARVFPKRGGATWAGIIAAIDWAIYGPDGIPNTGDEADVINMSLGGGAIYNSPIWLAIERAIEHGVVVVVAAGNEGDNQLYSMSVGDPGNSPLAITVGAVKPDYSGLDYYYGQYTSIGPTILLAVKPDIVAPSGTIVIDYQGGYTSSEWHGTSFSSPFTAGAVALILDYLIAHNVSKIYRPWIAKAILMKTAKPVYETVDTENIKYEDLVIGAGAIDLEDVFNELESCGISGGSYPQWLYILPTKVPVGISNSTRKVPEHLPYFPYFDRVFINQTLYFNFTIVASRNTTIEVTYIGDFAGVLEIHTSSTIDVTMPTTYWEFNFTVKTGASEGTYSGIIRFNDTKYGIIWEVPIQFKVVKPKIRVLMDLKHTDWDIDMRYGQYRFLVRALEVMNDASVEMLHHHYKGKITLDLLEKYDLIFIPDTSSYEPIMDENGLIVEEMYDNWQLDEIWAIHRYVEHGGTVVVFALSAKYHNISNINELLRPTKSKLTSESWYGTDSTVAVSVVGGHFIAKNITELPYQGITMDVSFISEKFLEYTDFYGKHDLAMCYQGFRGGGIIALGSNFMFDNWAFKAQYPGSGTYASNVYNFAKNIIDFVYYGKDIIDMVWFNTTMEIILPDTRALKVYANNTTALINLTWIYRDYEGNQCDGELTYNSSSGLWEGIIPISTQKYAYIVFKAYFTISGETYYVVRAGTIYVDYYPPTISLLTPSAIIIGGGTNVTIKVNISDDGALQAEGINVGLNISQDLYGLTLRNITRMMSIATIQLTWNSIRNLTLDAGRDKVRILIEVNASDYLGKTASEQLTVQITVDVVGPTIEITSPSYGAIVRGIIAISAEVTDQYSSVSKVEFYIDNVLLRRFYYSPYTYSLNTSLYIDGPHELEVVAYDSFGNNNTEKITVTIDNTAPSLEILSPIDGSLIKGPINITASAQDETTGVKKVEFYIDSILIDEISEAPYTTIYDSTAITDGSHTIIVIAYDNANNTAQESVSIEVDNTAPTIEILSPTNNSEVSGTIKIEIKVEDPVAGVDTVQVFINDEKIAEEKNTTSLTVELDTTKYDDGTYTISIVAIDKIGNQATANIVINIQNKKPSPPYLLVGGAIAGIAIIAIIVIFVTRKKKT